MSPEDTEVLNEDKEPNFITDTSFQKHSSATAWFWDLNFNYLHRGVCKVVYEMILPNSLPWSLVQIDKSSQDLYVPEAISALSVPNQNTKPWCS